jgi:hypothetical protein
MATFYKYQERDIDSQVNWADIGLGMSDMITDQVATRKAKKEAYDDEVRAFNQYLDEHPKGDDKNLTEWTSAYSSDMQKKMLENQRAFKNGMISERDNVTFTQNVKNGTGTIFNLATEFQAEYKVKMDRNNSTDPLTSSQPLEIYWMEQAEGYNNYRTSKPIIDPRSGLVLMSMKRKDGTYETVSAANLSNRIKATADMFDVNAKITANESVLGEEKIDAYAEATSRLKTGQNVTTEDKAIKAGFEKTLRDLSASSLVNPTATSSILTKSLKFEDILDADGKVIGIKPVTYTFTESKAEAEADPYKILLVAEEGGDGIPRPVFDQTKNGEKQFEMALGYMTSQTIGQIDRKVGTQVIGALGDPSDYQLSMGADKKILIQKGKDAGEQLAILLTSKNANLVQNAGANLSQLYAGISNLDKTGKNMNIGFGGKSNDFKGAYVTPYEYAKGVLNSLGLSPEEQKQALITFKQKAGTELNSYDARGVTPAPAEIDTGKYDEQGIFSGALFKK